MRVKITKVEKIKDENESEHLIVLASDWKYISNKDFRESLKLHSKQVEFCHSAPARFQLNTLYVRLDKKAAWIYILEGDEQDE